MIKTWVFVLKAGTHNSFQIQTLYILDLLKYTIEFVYITARVIYIILLLIQYYLHCRLYNLE